MNTILQHKKRCVDELSSIVDQSNSLVVAHYRGVTVDKMTDLRKKGRDSGVTLKVIKNTLAKRALVDSRYGGVTDKLVGPTILAFSNDEPNAAAKLIKDFVKECPDLQVQAVCLENAVFDASALDKVANMPNKEQAIALLLGMLQAPTRNLACTLQETYAKLARVVQAVADKRGSQQ